MTLKSTVKIIDMSFIDMLLIMRLVFLTTFTSTKPIVLLHAFLVINYFIMKKIISKKERALQKIPQRAEGRSELRTSFANK